MVNVYDNVTNDHNMSDRSMNSNFQSTYINMLIC